jgi:hypothetical protein
MHNITDVSTFTANVPVLDDGDPVDETSTESTIQSLANRTRYLYNETVKFVSSAVANVVIAALSGNTIGLQATGFGTGAGLKGIGGGVGVWGVGGTGYAGLIGESASSGAGIAAENTSSGIAGDFRTSSGTGRCVTIAGNSTLAPLNMSITTQPSGPNSVGDMYMAAGGVLKVCTVAGSPGTWVSVGAQV